MSNSVYLWDNFSRGISGFAVLPKTIGSLSVYAAVGFEPALVFDFQNEYYRTGGTVSTFDAAMTHARTSNATMVGSDGLLKWGPHNLLTNSSDPTLWATVAVSQIATGLEDPDGGNGAVEFDIKSAGELRLSSAPFLTQDGVSYVVGVWVKQGATSPATHTILSTNDNAAWNTGVAQKFAITNEWQFLSLSGDLLPSSAGTTLRTQIGTKTVSGGGYDADCIGRVVVYASRAYRSDLGGMVDNPDRGDSYVPTTSAARYLARRGNHVYNGTSWVNEGVLIESEARTNLFPQSNNLAAATLSVHTAVAHSEVGGYSLFTVTRTGTGDRYVGGNRALTASTAYTLSVVASETSSDNIGLLCADNADLDPVIDVSWNPATQAATTNSNLNMGTVVVHPAESLDNGLWRFAVSFTPSATTTYRAGVYAGTANTDNILAAALQLEAGSTPSSYIPTSSSTVTRAADTLTAPSANLPWPTPNVIGPELVTNGTFDTDTDWTKGTGWTISGGELVGTSVAAFQDVSQSSIGLVAGKVYQVTLDVSATSGGLTLYLGTNGNGNALLYNSDIIGTQSLSFLKVFVAGQADAFFVRARSTGFDGTIDNISIREIDPLAVSIQMDGRMTYADTSSSVEVRPLYWYQISTNNITWTLSTLTTRTGQFTFQQVAAGVSDIAQSGQTDYSPGINVPFNIASRHGSTFINGAVDGVALTADTTPVALPDLSATDLSLGYNFMGNIGKFRLWADDLADAGIATSSAPSLEPSLSLTFDGSEGSFTVLDWSE